MDDTISRAVAIDALKNRWKKTRNYEGIGDDIAEECELCLKQVPSAQPKIIKCKDCKHWFDIDDGRQLHKMCADICGDWFCADAERRTDDER